MPYKWAEAVLNNSTGMNNAEIDSFFSSSSFSEEKNDVTVKKNRAKYFTIMKLKQQILK